MNILNKLKIRYKIWLLVIVPILVLIVLNYLNAVYIYNKIYAEKKEKTRNVVESIVSTLSFYDKLAKDGKMSLKDAQEYAKSAVKASRYNVKEYFWINDINTPYPVMIMHPTVPALDGKTLDDAKFNCTTHLEIKNEMQKTDGKKNLFQATVEVVKNNDNKEGFLIYQWPKPLAAGGVSKETYPKLSFVKLYENWGWVIGSGIYVDELDNIFYGEIKKSIITLLIISIFMFLFGYIIARNIVKPIENVIEKQISIASGELSVCAVNEKIDRKDEIGLLNDNCNKMSNSLCNIVSGIATNSEHLNNAVAGLNNRIEQEDTKSTVFSEKLHTLASGTEEMAQTIVDISKNISDASTNAETTAQIAQQGLNSVIKTVDTINNTKESTMELSKMIEKLNNKVNEISTIVAVIKDIADQTNLLALNAAIEAARAGEQGRGFSVVADEVRKLAEKTIKSTQEISDKIASVQQEAKHTTHSMEGTVKEVEKSSEHINSLNHILNQALQSTIKIKDQIIQISASLEEQSATSEDLSKNINELSFASKERERLGEELYTEIQSIRNIYTSLNDAVRQFKI